MFLGLFWASFLLILGVLGRHFGSPKVNVNFDRKTGMDLNPGIPGNPGKSRDGGSRSPKNYQQDLPWTARPPEALHIVAEARWRIYIYIYIHGETPCSAYLPSSLTCMDFTKHLQNHCKTYVNAILLTRGPHSGSMSRTCTFSQVRETHLQHGPCMRSTAFP